MDEKSGRAKKRTESKDAVGNNKLWYLTLGVGYSNSTSSQYVQMMLPKQGFPPISFLCFLSRRGLDGQCKHLMIRGGRLANRD